MLAVREQNNWWSYPVVSFRLIAVSYQINAVHTHKHTHTHQTNAALVLFLALRRVNLIRNAGFMNNTVREYVQQTHTHTHTHVHTCFFFLYFSFLFILNGTNPYVAIMNYDWMINDVCLCVYACLSVCIFFISSSILQIHLFINSSILLFSCLMCKVAPPILALIVIIEIVG